MPDTKFLADPRHSNDIGAHCSPAEFVASYVSRLSDVLATVPAATIDRVARVLADAAEERRRVFVLGNGGSAAIADHVCCDLLKGTWSVGHPPLDATSLNANIALYTATANDFGFERVFARQIETLGNRGDVLIAISSSGNSENVLRAVSAAHAAGMTVIGLCGFEGGCLKEAADIVLHAAVSNYGLVEDSHMAWMHIVAQMISCRRDGVADW